MIAEPVASIVQDLIGCAWGRKVWAHDDPEPCPEQATNITVLHDGATAMEVRLCPRHKSRLVEETTEHEES